MKISKRVIIALQKLVDKDVKIKAGTNEIDFCTIDSVSVFSYQVTVSFPLVGKRKISMQDIQRVEIRNRRIILG